MASPAPLSQTPPLPVCCFTDYNEEAVHRAGLLVQHLLAADAGAAEGDEEKASAMVAASAGTVEVGMNAFRQPAAVLAADHALPSASNGFALWLLPRGAGGRCGRGGEGMETDNGLTDSQF